MLFFVFQIFGLIDLLASQRRVARGSPEYTQLRNNVVLFSGGILAIAVGVLLQRGHFGAVSLRVRGLFLKHTRTGNPLVDSVAEHQPTTNVSEAQKKDEGSVGDAVGPRPTPGIDLLRDLVAGCPYGPLYRSQPVLIVTLLMQDAYWRNLHYACLVGPIGFVMSFFKTHGNTASYWGPENSKIFLILYGITGYFFATKMARLIILMGPIASALSGVALGALANW